LVGMLLAPRSLLFSRRPSPCRGYRHGTVGASRRLGAQSSKARWLGLPLVATCPREPSGRVQRPVKDINPGFPVLHPTVAIRVFAEPRSRLGSPERSSDQARSAKSTYGMWVVGVRRLASSLHGQRASEFAPRRLRDSPVGRNPPRTWGAA